MTIRPGERIPSEKGEFWLKGYIEGQRGGRLFGLTPLEMRCVIDYYVERLLIEEIAGAVDKTPKAIRRAIERACSKLGRLGLPMPRMEHPTGPDCSVPRYLPIQGGNLAWLNV